jgi:hypothetical protein
MYNSRDGPHSVTRHRHSKPLKGAYGISRDLTNSHVYLELSGLGMTFHEDNDQSVGWSAVYPIDFFS